jgi:hypothetical protein
MRNTDASFWNVTNLCNTIAMSHFIRAVGGGNVSFKSASNP